MTVGVRTAALAISFAVFATPVAAQHEAASDDAAAAGLDAEARATFEAGELALANGRFDVALSRFRESHRLSNRPILLFNIGVAAERLRRDREALAAFQQYLREIPDADNRLQVQERIRVLEQSIADRPTQSDTVPDSSSGRLWTWIALGAGAVMLGVSALFWVNANADQRELDDDCVAMGGCTDEQVDAGWESRGIDGQLTATNVLLGVGLATITAGVVLFFVEGGSDDAATAVEVGIGPRSVAVRGRF